MKKNFKALAIVVAVALLGLFAVAAQSGDDAAQDATKVVVKKVVVKEGVETPAPAAKTCGGMCCCPCCCRMSGMKMMMHAEAPAAPAPGAPPVPPAPPASPEAVAAGAAMPECPMMKDMARPCCPMMAREGMHAMRMKRMQGTEMMPGMKGHMSTGGFPMWRALPEKADIAVENTADGAVVRITSKDPEAVKMIQEHLAAMKAARAQAQCPKAVKAEEKKEK